MGPKCLIFVIALLVTKQSDGQIDGKVDDSVLPEDGGIPITTNEKIQTPTLEDPLEILHLIENIKLEKEIQKIKDENKEIVNRNMQEIKVLQNEKSELEQKYENKMEEAGAVNMNSDILVRFMKNIIFYNDKKTSSCQGIAQAQKEKLDFLEEEKISYKKKDVMNVKNTDLQDVIIKSQGREIEILNATVKMQRTLYEDYEKMNKFDIVNNMDNFPVYAQILTKIMSDQSENIKQMKEYFEDEKEVSENMEQILKEIQDLKLGFSTGKSDWSLLDQYKDIIAILDANLKSILPTISYASESESNRGYHVETSDDGTLLEMTHCPCLPQKGETNVNVSFSAVELTCPDNTLFSKTLQRALEVPCAEEKCPQEIDDFCGNFTESGDWVRYPKGWGVNQCTPLGDDFGSTLAECKATCFKTNNCTAFNWGLPGHQIPDHQGHCVLLGCSLSATEPNRFYPGYHGFKRDCDCKDCEEPTTGCLEMVKCELPWKLFGDNCYKNITTEGAASCRSSCQEEGADIVSIHSYDEHLFLSNLVEDGHLTYIGADCQSSGCTWKDGSAWDYDNWKSGFPRKDGYCASIGDTNGDGDAKWIDGRVCTFSNADCICKK